MATRADVIVGVKTFDVAARFMKIRAESTLRPAVGVADVVAAYLAFSANSANFAHSDTSVKGKIDLPEYYITFIVLRQVNLGDFDKKIIFFV